MHLFTMNTDGKIFNAKTGEEVACLSDSSHITDFLSGVRAVVDGVGLAVPGTIIREGDYQAWEKAAVARTTGTCGKCGADCRECENRV